MGVSLCSGTGGPTTPFKARLFEPILAKPRMQKVRGVSRSQPEDRGRRVIILPKQKDDLHYSRRKHITAKYNHKQLASGKHKQPI
jgi:hypothetical protein